MDAISAAQEELVLAGSTLLFTCVSADLAALYNAASAGLTETRTVIFGRRALLLLLLLLGASAAGGERVSLWLHHL